MRVCPVPVATVTNPRQDQRGLLRFRLRFEASQRSALVNDNHPVLNALEARLRESRLRYEHHPSEHTRYQLVKLERLITEWAPGSLN